MSDRRSKWIECGKFGRPWGIKGQISVFCGARPVEVGRGEIYTQETGGNYVPHLVLSSRHHNGRSVVAIAGVTTPEEAKSFTNKKIYLPQDALPKLKENEYYGHQILGLDVVLKNGGSVGKVVHIFSTGSNDVYEVAPPKGDTILIPAIDTVIKHIDLDNGKMIIEPMEGMLD